MRPYRIPFELLPYFRLTEDRFPHDDPDAFSSVNIFDLARLEGATWHLRSFTSLRDWRRETDYDRLQQVVLAADAEHDLYFAFVGGLDPVGHETGGQGPEMSSALSSVDRMLKQFVREFATVHPEAEFLFVGDHGMTPVTQAVDGRELVARAAAEVGLDGASQTVLTFLDSTMVRIWLPHQYRNAFADAITSDSYASAHGNILETSGIASATRVNGDLVWAARPGVVVSPDYFRGRATPMGMHGYGSADESGYGMAIHWGPQVESGGIEEMPLTSIFATLQARVSA